MTDRIEHISVCICTFRRPRCLKRLLRELDRQDTEGKFTYSIIVADNDQEQSARAVTEDFATASSIPVHYCVEPEQNIALARNKAIGHASGDYIAFIDDDEFPAKNWLVMLFKARNQHKGDGVLGPVKPIFEQQPPQWLIRGRFYERPEHQTGSEITWREGRTGNVLFKSQILADIPGPFRRQFGSGSEDTDFFRRMAERGRVFTWCNEAIVYEFVPPMRWKRSYMLKRALLRGQNQRHLGSFSGVAKSVVAVPLYMILLPFLLLFGQQLFMKYLIKLFDHTGKLLAVLGFTPLGNKYITE